MNEKLKVSFAKTYGGPFKVRVFEDLTPDQFRYAQRRNVMARVNPRAHGAWCTLCEILERGATDAEAEVEMGQLLYAINPKHEPEQTWRPTIQAARRGIFLRFVRDQFLKAKGRVDGHTKPNDGDMRKLDPLAKADVAKWEKENPMEPSIRSCKTLEEYVALVGETEFVREYRSVLALSGQTNSGGPKGITGTKLIELIEKFKDAPSSAGLLRHVAGRVGWTGKEIQDLLIAYTAAADECFRTYEPEKHAELKAQIADAAAKAASANTETEE